MVDRWNRVLMEVNNSAIGAHMVMMPTDFIPNPNMLRGRKEAVPMVEQRQRIYFDANQCQPEWLHPPYESKPSEPWIFSGSKSELAHFPIIF
jgi:hypothetical protein